VTRPLRIAVASSGLGHVARGVEAWADDLAAALAARGQAVALYKGGGRATRPYERVLPCWQREAAPTGRLLRVLPRRLSWRIGLGSPYGVEQVTFGLALVRRLRRTPADVLHVQDPVVAIIAQRARRLGLIRTRTVLAHGTEEPFAFQRKVTFLQHLAPWHLDEARRAGVARRHWAAIPNFIDTDQFAPGTAPGVRAALGLPADARVVLSVAAIKRDHKRVDYLVAEFARLRAERPDLPAYLVVAGGWEPGTDELVAEGRRALGDRVRFLVRCPRDRMPDLYRAADLFALASLKEMMPVAVLEASASGLPCLVHRHPVLEWMVGPGGEAIDMIAPGELAAGLGRWLGDPDRCAEAGRRAREHCQSQFSVAVVVDRILNYYRRVAASEPEGVAI
jgi:glycosyltransferase involved in cell wall biosynthesis